MQVLLAERLERGQLGVVAVVRPGPDGGRSAGGVSLLGRESAEFGGGPDASGPMEFWLRHGVATLVAGCGGAVGSAVPNGPTEDVRHSRTYTSPFDTYKPRQGRTFAANPRSDCQTSPRLGVGTGGFLGVVRAEQFVRGRQQVVLQGIAFRGGPAQNFGGHFLPVGWGKRFKYFEQGACGFRHILLRSINQSSPPGKRIGRKMLSP